MTYVALITGASSGIGEATARRLAQQGDTRLVLVARRRELLERLAGELGGAQVIDLDLTEPDAPAAVLEAVQSAHGRLDLLVNNAGAAWRGAFADKGWAGVERHLKLDFEAPVRLTEALLPLLRHSAATADPKRRVAIVNVASTAARVSRPRSGGYSAAKFALAGWSDALYAEEREHGVHVGLVLPGFVKTEGFPAAELLARPQTRWMVSTPEAVAEAIVAAGPGGHAERYVPRWYWVAAVLRILAPGLIRRAVSRGGLATTTKGDA